MKVLICGASGMLGSHVQRLLQEEKISHAATDAKQLDITSLDAVMRAVEEGKFTHAINCAAYTQVDKAEIEKEKAMHVNALGPYHLGVAGKEFNMKVIHFSTDYVFDGAALAPYREDDPCNAISAYGISKWEGELRLLEVYPKACIIRTSWLFGYPGKNFVNTMLQLMQEREQLRVVADQVGCPTYCQDLAQAALKLSEAEGIFHFANSEETSWHEFAEEICRQAIEMGFPIKTTHIAPIVTEEYPTPAKRPFYSTLDTEKVEAYLGYRPRPWREALREYLNILSQQILQKV